MSNLVHSARGAVGHSRQSTLLQSLGRFGDVCYGIVHIVVAVLAIRLAFGSSNSELDQKGAVSAIAAQPFGTVVLWVIAIGLFAFGLWQLLSAASGFQWVRPAGKRTRRRIGAAGRGIAVIAIGVFTVRLLVSDRGSSGNSHQQQWTAQLLAMPGGRVLVGVIGAAIVVAAGAIAWRGAKRKFLRDLDLPRVSARRWAERLGVTGFVAKGVAYAIVGILVIVAAIEVDPKRVGGLDAALHTLAAQPFGVVLLAVVALGLAAYGGYCFVEARYRKR